MVQDLSKLQPHHPKRFSLTRHGSGNSERSMEGGLKSMMSNLLPSLDASMDSHFSKDFSHSDVTATTAAHTSATSYNFGQEDLEDSSCDEEMTVSQRLHSKGSRVRHSLKKAFGKMKKRTRSKSSSKKDKKSKSKSSSKSSKHKNKGHKEMEDSYDEISVDSTIGGSIGDPPTVCSAAPLLGDDHSEEDTEDYREFSEESQQQRRRRSRSRPRKSIHRKKTRSRSAELVNDDVDSSESARHNYPRLSRSSTTGSAGRGKREELKKRRSSRRSERPSSGNRLPPKSKSYDCVDRPPPLMSAMEADRENERPGLPKRAASMKIAGSGKQRSSRGLTAQAAIPNPRRNSSMKKQEQQSNGRRRSGEGSSSNISRSRSFKQESGTSSSKKLMSRSKSFKHAGDDCSDGKPTKQKPPRAKSFDGATDFDLQGGRRRRSISRSREKRKSNPGRVPTAPPPVELCRHGEKLGECCYEQTSSIAKGAAAPPLFSLEDHFGGSGITMESTDEVSIDTASMTGEQAGKKNSLSAFAVICGSNSLSLNNKNINHSLKHSNHSLNNKNSNHSNGSHGRSKKAERRRRSKSRSQSPSIDRSRSRSRSTDRSSRSPSPSPPKNRSKSRTRKSERERPVSQSRRPSHGDRGRSDRKRSQSRTNSSERNSSGRDRRQSSSEGENRQRHSSSERSQSRPRRPSVKPRGRSKSVARRKSFSQQRSASRSRSRSTSRSRRESFQAKTLKQYETLSKEDLLRPKGEDIAKGRRPRSLSTNRRKSRSSKGPEELGGELAELIRHNQRISRSLSRTRKSKDHEGIGNYLKRQPQRPPTVEEDANSQSTGSKTTGSNEVSYATPSWMWNKSTKSNVTGSSFSNSFFNQWEDFNQTKEDQSSNPSGDVHNQFYNSWTRPSSSSYDAGTEMTTPVKTAADASAFPRTPMGSNPVGGGTGKGFSPPLELNQSLSSLSSTATPCTKAKHFYDKVTKKEQEELRAHSQELFSENKAPSNAATTGNAPRSMFAPMSH